MLKQRALSLLMAVMLLFSLAPTTALAAESGSIAIQEQAVAVSAASVTVNITGYEELSGAKLKLTAGPAGTQSDYDMKGRTTLKVLTFTGPGTYEFQFDPGHLTAGENVQAFLFYYDADQDKATYRYSDPVDIVDGEPVPSAAIVTDPVTDRTTELTVKLSCLPERGIFRVIQLEGGETFRSDKLNSYPCLAFSLLSNLKNGENTLALSSAPAAGSRLLAVIRDSTGEDAADYLSAPVAVTAEQEPSIVSITGGADSASRQVTVHLTRVPSRGTLKIIELDPGEAVPAGVFDAGYDALYTGYFFSAGLKAGDNVLTLTRSPSAGKVLYAAVRDASGETAVDFVSDGAAVAAASVPFHVFIKGELTDRSTAAAFVTKMKSSSQTPSTLESALLCRSDADGAADVSAPLARAEAAKAGGELAFTGLSGLTAGETLKLAVTYDGGRTAEWTYTVCDADETDSFRIVEQSFTTASTTVTMEVSGYNWYNNRADWSRICISAGSAMQTQPGDDEGREDLTSQVYTGKGTYTFTIPQDRMSALKAGDSIMAALRFYDGDGVEGIDDREYYAAVDTVLISAAAKTPLERLANCSAAILRDGKPWSGSFRQEQTTLDYSVTLDDEIPSGTLCFYAYPGNTSFDPDGNHKLSLGSRKITQRGSGSISLDLSAVPVGYRVVASLYVCIDGEDWYRTVTSDQRPEVVDENGQGFQDYEYPDAVIDETELQAGAVSLHVSLTGDERLFQAAREGKTTISISVAQYPDGQSFDFERADQISLARSILATQAFSGREIALEHPLKVGYRVRAVVYWTQNADIFLAPGNDYEEKFHKQDDSVLISSAPEALSVTAEGTVSAGDASLVFTVGGTVPSGSLLLVKSYDAADTNLSSAGGELVGIVQQVTGGAVTVPVSGALTAGRQVAAFLLSGGEVLTRSQPVTVSAARPAAPFTAAVSGTLTPDSTQLSFTLSAADPSSEINAVYLCRVVNGNAEYDAPVATLRNVRPGALAFAIPAGSLTVGETLRIVVQYWKNDDLAWFSAADVPVAAEHEQDVIAIQETSFTEDSVTVTVRVSGYESFRNCSIFLTTGAPFTDGDGDSRTRLGSQKYTAAGTYTFTLSAGQLKGGNTVQAHLYRYDGDLDRTYYQYSGAVPIEKGPTEPELSIVTRAVTTDTAAVYVSASFDGSALLTLYAYTGGCFDPSSMTEAEYNGYAAISYLPSAPDGSFKVELNGVRPAAGSRLTAVLWSGGLGKTVLAQSAPVEVTAAPEKEPPAAYILTQRLTAGMTYLTASLRFDSSISSADYKLYQFRGDTLDTETAELLNYGSLYRSALNQSIRLGIGTLKPGSSLQLVLTAGGEEVRSNIITVLPSPDWGTPYAAFAVSAVKSDSDSVALTVDYSDQYLTMGDEFYCDVTVYACSGAYTDEEIEDGELWENYTLCRAVAKANSRQGAQTCGGLTLSFFEHAQLKAGEKLFIKLRLPHVEWEGEEVDYVSASIPVLAAEAEIPDYQVVLYNLSADTSRGGRLRAILERLAIPVQEMTYARLNESVGYLAGLEGYEAAGAPYDGEDRAAEFMLICNLPEALLDRFLDAMQENGLRIDHKAVVTAYNRDMRFCELMDEIAGEHSVFQMLLTLSGMTSESKALTEAEYGSSPSWASFQTALAAAEGLIRSEEPSYEALSAAYETLKTEYLAVTGLTEPSGAAVITLTPEEGGAFALTVSVQDGPEGAEYEYRWSSGETARTVTGIPAERLVGTTVTVTGPRFHGALTAQLQVPALPAPAVTAGPGTVTVRFREAAAGKNTPAAAQYIAELLLNGAPASSKTVTAAQSVTFTGLAEKTAYTVRMYAVSPVGRSDILTQTVTTTAASHSGGGSGGSSGGGSSAGGPSSGASVRTNPDGSRTSTVTNAATGAATETTSRPDGSTSVVETQKNGTVTTTVTAASGVKTRTVEKPGAETSVSVTVPGGADAGTVILPVQPSAGLVAVDAATGKILKLSVPTAEGLAVRLDGSAELILRDGGKVFDDTRDHWTRDAVSFAAARGLLTGKAEDRFAPNDATTRAQIMTVMARLNDADTSDRPLEKGVSWAKAQGISDGSNANAAVSRQQLVTMLWRAAGSQAAEDADLTGFSDAGAVSSYAEQAMRWAVAAGLIGGTSSGALDPAGTATRGQFAVILQRYVSLMCR